MATVSIGDAELYYEIHGDGPPLMLVSGLGGTGRFWFNQVDAFAEHYTVYLHDHRGCGQSTKSRIAYSVDQMADDTLRLMDALGIESAHQVGHSTGGAIGQTIAIEHPERLRGLVISASWTWCDPYFRREFETRRNLLTKYGPEEYVVMSTLTRLPPWQIAEDDEAITEFERRQIQTIDVEIVASRIDAILKFDRRDGLGDITAPTLVICARDDQAAPFHFSEDLTQRIKGAKLVQLEGGAHYAPQLRTKEFNEAVLGFLATLD